MNDVRFAKDGVARALRTLRAATNPEPDDRVVPLSAQMVGLRFTTAAAAAGVESRVTAHLVTGRAGVGSDALRHVDHRRDAGGGGARAEFGPRFSTEFGRAERKR